MRIIAGDKRGTQIVAPKGLDTRPTQDRVRESLFNIIRAWLPDASVLDLFAGSGALALEALSRGAREAVLVDVAQEPYAAICRNVEKLGYGARARTLRLDCDRALRRLADEGVRFDVVFLDPPYRMEDTGALCRRMRDGGLLNPGALIVIEHRADMTPQLGDGFTQRDERRYHDTAIHLFTYEGA